MAQEGGHRYGQLRASREGLVPYERDAEDHAGAEVVVRTQCYSRGVGVLVREKAAVRGRFRHLSHLGRAWVEPGIREVC
jgi:hypothetical protein